MKAIWGELGEVVRLAVQEMQQHGVPVTPAHVEGAVQAVHARPAHPPRETRFFLTPDGRRIHAVAMQRPDERRFMLPTPYFTLDAEDVERLQREATALRSEIDNPATPWADRTRASARVRDLETRLNADRLARQPWMDPQTHGRG